jgi:hypothetical protein
MAASHNVKLGKGEKVGAFFEGDVKKLFKRVGNDATGELTALDDGSTKIAYKVQGESVTFTVTKSPRLFDEKDQKLMLKNLFG